MEMDSDMRLVANRTPGSSSEWGWASCQQDGQGGDCNFHSDIDIPTCIPAAGRTWGGGTQKSRFVVERRKLIPLRVSISANVFQYVDKKLWVRVGWGLTSTRPGPRYLRPVVGKAWASRLSWSPQILTILFHNEIPVSMVRFIWTAWYPVEQGFLHYIQVECFDQNTIKSWSWEGLLH